jgi:hypothetical protein
MNYASNFTLEQIVYYRSNLVYFCLLISNDCVRVSLLLVFYSLGVLLVLLNLIWLLCLKIFMMEKLQFYG